MKKLYIKFRYQSKTKRKNKRLYGSYTVEATMIMAIVLLVIMQIIKGAFYLHDQVRGTMVLQEAVEQIRRGEWDEDITGVQRQGNEKAAPLFYLPDYRIDLKKYGPLYQGHVKSRVWEKEISIRQFDPEEFLRLVRGAIF